MALHEPDAYQSCRTTRQHLAANSVVACACLSVNGPSFIRIIEGELTAKKYISFLEELHCKITESSASLNLVQGNIPC